MWTWNLSVSWRMPQKAQKAGHDPKRLYKTIWDLWGTERILQKSHLGYQCIRYLDGTLQRRGWLDPSKRGKRKQKDGIKWFGQIKGKLEFFSVSFLSGWKSRKKGESDADKRRTKRKLQGKKRSWKENVHLEKNWKKRWMAGAMAFALCCTCLLYTSRCV